MTINPIGSIISKSDYGLRPMEENMARRNSQLSVSEVAGIVKADAFAQLPWWDKLNGTEKQEVLLTGQKLGQALLHYGQSKLSIGEYLSALKAILEPHNVFQKFLSQFHFSKSSAYRYIKGYENAKTLLPPVIMKAAMVRGVNLIGDSSEKPLGIYTAAAKTLSTDAVATEEQANDYLAKLEVARKSFKVEPFVMPKADPNTLTKECLRFVATRYARLPNRKVTREAWVKQLVGLMLSEFGIQAAQTFQPLEVPAQFKAPRRGRPVGSVGAVTSTTAPVQAAASA